MVVMVVGGKCKRRGVCVCVCVWGWQGERIPLHVFRVNIWRPSGERRFNFRYHAAGGSDMGRGEARGGGP